MVALVLLSAPLTSHAQDAVSEAKRRRGQGVAAAKAGDLGAARHHLLAAVALDPSSVDLYGDLAALDRADPELRALWAHAAALAGCDASGRVAKAQVDLADASRVVVKRARAAKAAAAAAGRLKNAVHEPTRQWLLGLSRTLTDGSSVLSTAHVGAFEKAAGNTAPDVDKLTSALAELMQSAYAAGDLETALEAARTMRGLAMQAGQAKNAPALPTAALTAALAMIRKVRADLRRAEEQRAKDAVAGAEPVVWTVESLESVPEDDVDAWSAKRTKWTAPGVALSPTELYRVETICGHATLLHITRDVEYHHARLIKWYGRDPFDGRRGLVRLSPDYRDFEGEGAPFWWAGGFQAGDVTTMIVRFASRDPLNGTLCHELTHRFDGAIFPGMPSWLSEGHAVYTARGSLYPEAEEVDEDIIRWNDLGTTHQNGYATPKGLRDFITGRVDDYRHNYPGGYSLYTFLRRFRGFDGKQKDKPLFASRLPAYMASFRARSMVPPEKRLVGHFADGKDGRPDGFSAFADMWARFLREGGLVGRDKGTWVEAWDDADTEAREKAQRHRSRSADVFDRKTFQPGRTRHDPPDHGQEHARVAARLLTAGGKTAAALEAYHWALRADEATAEDFVAAAALAESAGREDVAWVSRLLAHRIDPPAHAVPEGELSGAASPAWRAARAAADAYGVRAAAAHEAGHLRLARALRAEQDAIVAWLGQARIADLTPEEATLVGGVSPRVPELRPERNLVIGGLVEERWAPLDSEPGEPWYAPDGHSVELGRREPGKSQTGQVRDGRERRIFVRTKDWLSGTYSVRVRVRFLSLLTMSRIVIGQTHRDRGVEIHVNSGEWRRDDDAKKRGLRSIQLNVTDLRPYSGKTSPLSERVGFSSPREVFEVVAHVTGPYVRVLINGKERVSFRRETGQPIEGHVGFGLQRGIVRFEEPVTRRHRVLGPDRVSPAERFDAPLDLSRESDFPWDTIVGRRVVGLPRHARGTLLLWWPEDTPDELWELSEMNQKHVKCTAWVERGGFPVSVRVAVPQDAPEDIPVWAEQPFLRHHGHADVSDSVKRAGEEEDGGGYLWRGYPPIPVWLMLDERNVVRSAGPRAPTTRAVALAHALAGR